MSELWERQRRSFENTAESYDRYRPTYPDAVFDALHDYANLRDDDRILEIGCATGQATKKIAPWGHRLLALEPAPAMIERATQNLAAYANVTFETTTFEEWTIHPDAFGLIYSAQAFHWLDPKTRHKRCAQALRSGGTLALIWNTQITPPHNRPFFERVQKVYLEHAPAIAHIGEFRLVADDDNELNEMRNSGLFDDCVVQRFDWNWTLDRDTYIGLLSTHSPHAALPDDQRSALLEGIGALIDTDFDGLVTEHHTAELFCGHKV